MITKKRAKEILDKQEKENQKAYFEMKDEFKKEKENSLVEQEKKNQNTISKIKSNNKKVISDIKKTYKEDLKDISEKISKTVEKALAEERLFNQKQKVSIGDSFYDEDFYVYESYDGSMTDAVSKMGTDEFLKKYSHRINDKDAVKQQLEKIREGDTGWTQLGLGTILDIERYQSLPDLWAMQDAAYNKSRTNPIARSIVNTIQHYTVGRGLKFEAPDQKVQQFLMNFWTFNKMDLRQKELVKSTYIEGEYFILYFISKKTGRVKVRRIRPKEIDSIESHPEDIETILAYKRVRKSWDSRLVDQRELHYADVDYFTQLNDENIDKRESEVHKNLEDDRLVQFVRYNDNPDEVRGRVPMDSVMKYLKYYEDWLLDRVRLNHERSKVVWIKTIRGRGTEINTTRTRSPKGGQILQETNNIKYRIENPQINADRSEQDGLAILYAIGSGVTIPLHVLNQRGDKENYSCGSEDMEILSKRGWLKHDSLTEDDVVGTVNLITEKFEWQKVDKKFVYDHDGDMYRIRSRSVEGLFTGNHEMVMADCRTKVDNDGKRIFLKPVWKKMRMDNLYDTYNSTRAYIMNSVEWEDSVDKYNKFDGITIGDNFYESELFLKFLGIFIGDGCICFYEQKYKDSVYPFHYISFHVKKERKIKYFSPILEKMGFSKYVKSDGDLIWNLRNEELAFWIKDNIGTYCYNKKLPDFISKLPKDQLLLFYTALMESDGHYVNRGNGTGRRYTTTSKELAEGVFLMAIRLGFRGYLDSQFYPEHARRVCYYVQMSIPNEYRRELLTEPHNITKEQYKGKVWCVNVPNNTVVTRFNKKICITGNSIKKMDTPFSQGMIFNQDFWIANFDKMFRVALHAGVVSGKLNDKVSVPRFKKEKVFEAMRLINEMVLDKKPQDEIVKEATKILKEGKHETITIPTEEIPITKIFPDVFREDALAQAGVLQVHSELRIVSNQTLSEMAGYNWQEELFRMKQERDMGIGVEAESDKLEKNKKKELNAKNKVIKKSGANKDDNNSNT